MCPVTPLMLGVSNPVAYHTSNLMTVIEDMDVSNTSVVSTQIASDVFPVVAAFIRNIESPVEGKMMQIVKASQIPTPFMVLHVFWRASVSPWSLLPISFDCLLDDGSHLVLIWASLVKQLDLHIHTLPLLIKTELTMQDNEQKIIVILTEYVHLSLYDKTGEYSTWTIHAIVAHQEGGLACLALLRKKTRQYAKNALKVFLMYKIRSKMIENNPRCLMWSFSSDHQSFASSLFFHLGLSGYLLGNR